MPSSKDPLQHPPIQHPQWRLGAEALVERHAYGELVWGVGLRGWNFVKTITSKPSTLDPEGKLKMLSVCREQLRRKDLCTKTGSSQEQNLDLTRIFGL